MILSLRPGDRSLSHLIWIIHSFHSIKHIGYKIAIVKLIVFVFRVILRKQWHPTRKKILWHGNFFWRHFFGAYVRPAGLVNSKTKVRLFPYTLLHIDSTTHSIGMRKTISYGEVSVHFYINKFERWLGGGGGGGGRFGWGNPQQTFEHYSTLKDWHLSFSYFESNLTN